MTQLQTLPPPATAIEAMSSIPGLAISPSILVAQQGPDTALGPEGAGAVLMLQATFASAEGAEGFWQAAVPLMALLADAPGMIRRYSFPDGPNITLLALWRSIDDAKAFAATPQHRAAVRGLRRLRWQYTHFSALWELHHSAGRQFFCDACDEVTGGPATTCAGCGAALTDTYAPRNDAAPA
jgi:hypothetical protein